VYADGSEERVRIAKLPRKPPRFRYRKVRLDRSRKKGFDRKLTSRESRQASSINLNQASGL
jgi:hypothetical protein